MRPIRRSYLIELTHRTTQPSNGSKLTFDDISELRGVFITGVEAFFRNSINTSPGGKVVPLDTAGPGLVLSLQDTKSSTPAYQYPVTDLMPRNNGGFYRDLEPFALNLNKSYVTVLDNTGLLANYSLVFNMFFLYRSEFIKLVKLGKLTTLDESILQEVAQLKGGRK